MSSPTPPVDVYVLDTSALMDWHDRFYPPDVFPSLVVYIDALLAAGRLRSPEMVRDEINSIGSTALQHWVKARPTLFDPTANHLAQALAVAARTKAAVSRHHSRPAPNSRGSPSARLPRPTRGRRSRVAGLLEKELERSRFQVGRAPALVGSSAQSLKGSAFKHDRLRRFPGTKDESSPNLLQ